MATPTGILDLPVDILFLIFPYLDAPSFLHLTSTCKALHNPQFIHDHQYWSLLVRTTFRVPNQPVVQNDGERWQKLFKRLLRQSKIYTWGNNEKACLGHFHDDLPRAMQNAETMRDARMMMSRRQHVSWPGAMQETRSMGVVSDLQCGGWSTSMLTAQGAVYTVGVIDGLPAAHGRTFVLQQVCVAPTPLQYPPGYVPPHQRHDVATAIKQFSAGRAHILGLSDSGRIWSWQNVAHRALQVRFLNHDTAQDGRACGRGTVKKVVAGWNKSAALIEGTGIVIWEPLRRGPNDSAIEDAALVLESAVVPNTNAKQGKDKSTSDSIAHDAIAEDSVGEVLNFVVLEEVVLFNTHLGKVFVAQIYWSGDEQRVGEPIQLDLHKEDTESEDNTPEDSTHTTDVQGSFHSFAVFTKSGGVLTSTQDRLMDLLQNQPTGQTLFTRIPALQNKSVISLAFGDYHFHALHATGHITSYGNEPQACGALGLGGHGDPEGRLRGIRYQGIGGDGRLVPHAYSEGRRVWFEEEKQQWIRFITAGGVDPAEAAERMRMALGSPGVICQGEVSEWIEQQGRDWEAKFGIPRGDDDDGLGAYFALSVTAAGWHSGALVLVNEDLANKIKDACEVPDQEAEKVAEVRDEDDAQDRLDEEDEQPTGSTVAPPTPQPPPTTPSPNLQQQQQTLLTFLLLIALDYSRWFLGMAPYNAPPRPGYRPTAVHGGPRAPTPRFQRGTDPLHFGQSPREGVKYVWANDHFPRLRLSNGVEMPGEVEFDEWRFERPGFDLDAGM